jgi:hypothetical protein
MPRNPTSTLFTLARASATARAVSSGSPRRVARRGKNILLGRALFGREGIFRWIWK